MKLQKSIIARLFLSFLLATTLVSCKDKVEETSGEYPGVITVGHLVGICMSPLFIAYIKGFFKDEGLDVQPKWITTPGDSVNLLSHNKLQVIHNPFIATYRAVDQGVELKIIAGSGNHGLVTLAQPELGIQNGAQLAARANQGLKVGSQKLNSLELAFFSLLRKNQRSFKDYDMHFFHDHFTMQTAFIKKAIDVVTHVEPYATMLSDQHGGIRIGDSVETWGHNSPDCVVTVRKDFLEKYPITVKKYVRAILRADHYIKAHLEDSVEELHRHKFYRVDKNILAASIPRQPPGVDLTLGLQGLQVALKDAQAMKYIKVIPNDVLDLSILEAVKREQDA